MGTHGPEEFTNPVPTLPPDVVACDEISRSKWNFRPITLRNKKGVNVTNVVCQNVDANLVFDSDGKPLRVDRIVVQIVESLCEEEVPSGWMWSIHSWHIKQVFLDGVSLYDHDQTHIYNVAMNAINHRVRKGVKSYESFHERMESDVPSKKEALLYTQAITEVSTKTCCQKNCLQPFPHRQIQAI